MPKRIHKIFIHTYNGSPGNMVDHHVHAWVYCQHGAETDKTVWKVASQFSVTSHGTEICRHTDRISTLAYAVHVWLSGITETPKFGSHITSFDMKLPEFLHKLGITTAGCEFIGIWHVH